VTLRMSGASKAGPVVTDNSNFILDWFFDLASIKDSLGDHVSFDNFINCYSETYFSSFIGP